MPRSPAVAVNHALRALAVYRLTRLVVEDEITAPLREAVLTRWPESRAAYLVTCPYCVGVWAGALAVVLPEPAVRALAYSTAPILAQWAADALRRDLP